MPQTRTDAAGHPTERPTTIKVESTRTAELTVASIVLLAAALVARRSLRLGRSDRKGAFRSALFILSFHLLTWLFEASHVPHFAGELALVFRGLLFALFFLLSLLLIRILLRKWWLWGPAFVLFNMAAYSLLAVGFLACWLMVAAIATSLLLLYTRLGLLAAIAFFLASYMLHSFPITADLDAWYWGSSLYALTVVAALGVYGFYTSTTGKLITGEAAGAQEKRKAESRKR